MYTFEKEISGIPRISGISISVVPEIPRIPGISGKKIYQGYQRH